MDKNFNIIIVGFGGQGLITLNNIIAQAAYQEEKEVRTSELHGLSQRRGSVETFIRFGEKVFSPLFSFSKADLVLALEMTEGLRAVPYKNKETNFVVNENYLSFEGNMQEKEVAEKLKSLLGNKLHFVPASEICKKELGKEVVSSICLLGYCVFKKIIPLKEESVLEAIEKTIPEKYLELNKKAFNLAKTL